MIALVCEEGSNTGGSVRSVVVREFSDGQELGPVVLLIGTVNSDVLLQGLINAFRLSVSFRMISGSVVQLHAERFSKCAKEGGDEFGTSVGGYVRRNSVFGEDMNGE